jgi:hypothetical protein
MGERIGSVVGFDFEVKQRRVSFIITVQFRSERWKVQIVVVQVSTGSHI